MNDIEKIKIGFAIALLAGLFTLGPLVNESSFSLTLFSIGIKITTIYWIFVVLLSLSVYFYALTLIKSEKSNKIFQSVGNLTYALALFYPPFIVSIYLISILVNIITPILKLDFIINVITSVIASIVTFLSGYFVRKIQKLFKKEDDKQWTERIKAEEMTSFGKTKILYDSKLYDLVIVELWNVIELSFKRVFLQKAIPYSTKSTIQIIETIKKNKLLPSTLIEDLEKMRLLRNKAAHPTDELIISREDADKALKATEKILIIINNYKERCYFCQKEYPLEELEVEDINGDYFACKNCIKEHPDWKGEILALGMDP